MMLTSHARTAYNRDAVLSASPVRLLTMLYDRLLLDLRRAESAQEQQRWAAAGEELVHGQAVVSELSSSLRMDVWEGAASLQALYAYLRTAMVNANVRRDITITRECIALVEPLREAWHRAANELPSTASTSVEGRPRGTLGVG